MKQEKARTRQISRLLLKTREAERMLFAYSRKGGFIGQATFAASHNALSRASDGLAGALALAKGSERLRAVFTLPAAGLWGRATALCGENFAHQVAAHLCRKLSIMMGVVAEDEAGCGDSMTAERLRALGIQLAAAADVHTSKGSNP